MNTAAATAILAAHDLTIRDAIAARDAIEGCGADWLAAHKAASAASAARTAEVKRLAGLAWDGGTCEMELCLYGRLLRRHTDPVRVTWADLR